jgi:hypothetical protein
MVQGCLWSPLGRIELRGTKKSQEMACLSLGRRSG